MALQIPTALLESLNGIKGFDDEKFLQVHNNEDRITSIRVNPKKFKDHWFTADHQPINFINYSPIPWCSNGYYLAERPSFTLDPLLHAGAYYVQEASSMFLWQILEQLIGLNTNGLKVLDLCAAPGGKSTLLANFFKNGLVVSNDVIKSRATILVENIVKWGDDNVVVTNNDATHFKALENYFDIIVIDAPCSGSGLFRRDNNAISEWSENNVNLCSQRQQRIVADVLPALKQGGLLIYSTCSYSKEENEMIVDELTTTHSLESKQISIDTSWQIIETKSEQQQGFGYRFYPYLTKGEGFFVAAFTKTTGALVGHHAEQKLELANSKEEEKIKTFFPFAPDYTLFKHADMFKLIRSHLYKDLQILAKYLYIKRAGVAIGNVKGKDVIPSHELAVSTFSKDSFKAIELNKTDALQFLRRKEFELNSGVGWHLITYCGLSLGWVKVLPNRFNNYYPTEWRILKD